MVAECVNAIHGEVVRLVKLDVCGNPVTGASSAVVVTDGFIRITPSPQYLDGQEHQQVKANGQLCNYKRDKPQLTRVELLIDWCVLDPDAIVIVTGDTLIANAGTTGTGVAFGEGLVTARYSLEMWQQVTGPNACDPTTGLQRYVYWAFMNVGNGKVNQFTFENAPFEFHTTGETEKVGPLWGNGPGSAGPWIPSAITNLTKHYLYNVTTTPPPVSACGAVVLA